jgi:hypothetical protein
LSQSISLTVGRVIAITALGLSALFSSFGLLATARADTTVYAVHRSILAGTAGSVVGLITTDGSLGVLDSSQITDWELSIDDGEGHGAMVLSPANSVVFIWGGLFSASALDLSFDFTGSNGGVLFQSPGIGGGENWWCLEGVASYCTLGGAGESVNRLGSGLHITGDNSSPIGLAGPPAAVPEPPPWALLLPAWLALSALRALSALWPLALLRQRPAQ